MKFEKRFLTTITLTALVATAFACSHGPTLQEYPDTANAREEVTKLESDVNVARNNQVDVLAPKSFQEVVVSLEDSKRSLEKQKSDKVVLHQVAEARGYFKRALAFAEVSHTNMEGAIVARQQAIAAGAPTHMPEEFKKADIVLKDVTADIEKNDLTSVNEQRNAIQLVYLDLELRSIKEVHLGSSRGTINKALEEGAKTFAPRTLAIAEKSFQDTDAYITANRHETAQVGTYSKETRRQAEHLLKITRESKVGKKVSAEDTALQIEGEQEKVAVKQNQLAQTEDKLENTQNKLAKGNSDNRLLAAANVSLESENAFNQRFEEARTEFSDSEAEVYKKGNTLMIRLKGLEFPVSQAVLKESNFPLLAKVQKVIKNFGTSSVIIEGHTDSNGGKALNQKLSTDRAQAVRQYLISNADGENLNIRSVGYDYQKPLATNKTLSGRAQNRRVDVLIRPEETKTN